MSVLADTKMPWQVIDGSIFTVYEYTTKTETGTLIKQPKAIAFNVGDKIAQHVVAFHNRSLEK